MRLPETEPHLSIQFLFTKNPYYHETHYNTLLTTITVNEHKLYSAIRCPKYRHAAHP
jgi:hypothetical protein